LSIIIKTKLPDATLIGPHSYTSVSEYSHKTSLEEIGTNLTLSGGDSSANQSGIECDVQLLIAISVIEGCAIFRLTRIRKDLPSSQLSQNRRYLVLICVDAYLSLRNALPWFSLRNALLWFSLCNAVMRIFGKLSGEVEARCEATKLSCKIGRSQQRHTKKTAGKRANRADQQPKQVPYSDTVRVGVSGEFASRSWRMYPAPRFLPPTDKPQRPLQRVRSCVFIMPDRSLPYNTSAVVGIGQRNITWRSLNESF